MHKHQAPQHAMKATPEKKNPGPTRDVKVDWTVGTEGGRQRQPLAHARQSLLFLAEPLKHAQRLWTPTTTQPCAKSRNKHTTIPFLSKATGRKCVVVWGGGKGGARNQIGAKLANLTWKRRPHGLWQNMAEDGRRVGEHGAARAVAMWRGAHKGRRHHTQTTAT